MNTKKLKEIKKEVEETNAQLSENDARKERDEVRIQLAEVYENLISIIGKYCDIKDEYKKVVSLWIIGSYMHDDFQTYPYLFINAMRGSGKTRLLRLITYLSGGEMLNSLTEAVLFRTTGMLGIDEFEGISRKGNEALKELLNSAYKKGIKVRRMRKAKGLDGEKQVVEEFEPYRPICMANIYGIEEVLEDRCISLILEKSSNKGITKLVENYEQDTLIKTTLTTLTTLKCRLCSVVVPPSMYLEWNQYVVDKHIVLEQGTTLTTLTHNTTLTTQTTQLLNLKKEEMFNKIDNSEIDGRNLELTLSLLLISSFLDEELFDESLRIFGELIKDKKTEDFTESRDVSLIDFVSQYTNKNFVSMKQLTNEFKEFLQDTDDWINPKWVGKGLKRTSLIVDKRRTSQGREVVLNIEKAQEKVKTFK